MVLLRLYVNYKMFKVTGGSYRWYTVPVPAMGALLVTCTGGRKWWLKAVLDQWKEVLDHWKEVVDHWKKVLVHLKEVVDNWKEVVDHRKEVVDHWKEMVIHWK